MATSKAIREAIENAVLSTDARDDLVERLEAIMGDLDDDGELNKSAVAPWNDHVATAVTSSPSFEDLPDNHPLKQDRPAVQPTNMVTDPTVANAPGSPLAPEERQADGSPRDDSHITHAENDAKRDAERGL